MRKQKPVNSTEVGKQQTKSPRRTSRRRLFHCMLSVLRGMHLRTILPAFLIKASKNSTITATGSEKQARSPKSQHRKSPASAAHASSNINPSFQSLSKNLESSGRVPGPSRELPAKPHQKKDPSGPFKFAFDCEYQISCQSKSSSG